MITATHLRVAFDRQLLLADLIGDRPWTYDLQSGTLTFGDRFAWHAEILGNESEEGGTLLWAWANEAARRLAAWSVSSSREKTMPQL